YGGPPGGIQADRLAEIGNEERLVLPDRFGSEIKHRGPGQHGPDEVAGSESDARFFPQLPHRSILGVFLIGPAATNGEPPTPLRVIDVVATGEEKSAIGVEHENPGRVAETHSLRAFTPVLTEETHALPAP